MAYNTKYILNYCNRAGKPLRIEIQLWDYIGETFILVNDDDYLQDSEGNYIVSNIDGEFYPERDMNPIEASSNPFSLTYHNDTSEKGGAIRATAAEMEIFEDMLFNIDDLATSDETEIRTVFYYDNHLEWIGFVTPDFFNVEITEHPFITLTASDRIGILKDVDYIIKSDITETVRKVDIVANILQQTGLDLNINIICGMYCDEFPVKAPQEGFEEYELNNPFSETWVNEYRISTDFETKETLNCYEVLQSLMNEYNCLITQYKGEWWIVNKFDIDNGGGVQFIYDSDGVFQNIQRVSFDETYFSHINTGGERTLIPAGAKNTYLLDHGPEMIYPLNHSLESTSLSIGDIEYWANNGPSISGNTIAIPSEYNNDGSIKTTYDNEFEELRISEHDITYLENHASVPPFVIGTSWILESEKFKVVTMDKRKSSFILSVKGVGKPFTAIMIGIFMEIEETGSPGVKHYFSLQNPIDQETMEYTGKNVFVLIPDVNSSSDIIVYPFGFENKYNSQQIAVDQEWEIKMNIAAAQNQTFDINTAKFFLRIYPNNAYTAPGFNDGLTQINNILESVQIEFLNDNQTPIGTIYQTIIEGKFTKPTGNREVLYGDYQMVGKNGYFYKYREDSLSIQYNEDGEKLKDWFTPYDNQRNPLLIHSLRQLTYSYGRAHDELRIGFDLDRINPFSHYAIKCFTDRYILVNPEDEHLQEKNGKYITARIGKYLNSKKFVLVEGKIDYLRGQFEGVLAQIRTNEVQNKEFIYSYFENNDIS